MCASAIVKRDASERLCVYLLFFLHRVKKLHKKQKRGEKDGTSAVECDELKESSY